ncbi:hypothetical protein LJB86_01775 [Deltaproteobacteria bacterium OttesenSCG-928-M10]|nr:hypothetical protein [Deltaproteobacteria bacterium OttesenSCG-928-M10]
MFDYQGYSEKKLLALCDARLAAGRPCQTPYWTSEHYSIGSFLREYAGYPSWLPLYVYAQHGATNDPQIARHEIENDAEAMLVFNREALNNFKAVSDKPCHLVTMPYALHRRANNIIQSPTARGTLAFPCHSTMEIDVVFDLAAYVKELRALPDEFQPVSICLHRSDIVKGLYKNFMEQGFSVYTAGSPEGIFFGHKLYDLMRHFKYTTSNHVGSYTYYSVEMGIPFSLVGEDGQLINKSDPNIPVGPMDMAASKYYQEEQRVFAGIHTEISPAQKEFVEIVLGIDQGLTGQELRQVLTTAYQARGGHYLKDAAKALKWQLKQKRRQVKRAVMGALKMGP